MRRKNIIEFEDMSWFPRRLKNYITDFLRCYISLSNIYKPIYEDIYQTLVKSQSTRIVDLCSGGGGPQQKLLQYISSKNSNNYELESITLTDIHPNIDAFKSIALKDSRIKYIDKSVDACNVQSELVGMRTIFTGFHHMDKTQAMLVLKNSICNNEAIGVFEITENSIFAITRMALFAGVAGLVIIPFTRPFSIKKLLWTPIAFIVNWWDAVASCFRTYSVNELEHMVKAIDEKEFYEWQIGKKWSFLNLSNITYLIGFPKKRG